jgi:hypothetical protein
LQNPANRLPWDHQYHQRLLDQPDNRAYAEKLVVLVPMRPDVHYVEPASMAGWVEGVDKAERDSVTALRRKYVLAPSDSKVTLCISRMVGHLQSLLPSDSGDAAYELYPLTINYMSGSKAAEHTDERTMTQHGTGDGPGESIFNVHVQGA